MTALTITDSSFSFTLFIRPSVLQDCSLIFLSGTRGIIDTYQARPLLGIDSSGNLITELPPTLVLIAGANISVNQWSHVAVTYSFERNNVSLYHNGLLKVSVPSASPASYNPWVSTPPIYVTLANPLAGPNGSVIIAQPFIGAIDEFYVWNRELNASEIYSAAHPN
jgi:hypothetical protein